MCVPTLAVCALATLTLQDRNQQANATPEGAPTSFEAERPDISEKAFVPKPVVAIAPPVPSAESSTVLSSKSSSISTAVSKSAIAAEPSSEDKVEIPVIPSTPTVPSEPPRVQPVPQPPATIPAPTSQPEPAPNLVQDSQRSRHTAAPTRVQIEGQELPAPGVLPRDFTIPVRPAIVVDPSITTNTPITDQEFPTPLPRRSVGSLEELARYREAQTAAVNRWAEQVRECLLEYPQLVSVKPNGKQLFVLFDGAPGKIVQNANGRLVCQHLS
jgi:hypothetical protein